MLQTQPQIDLQYNGFDAKLFFDAAHTRTTKRISYRYSVTTPTGVMFEGNQYCPSPTDRTDIAIVLGLLFYICLKPGDTDQEYFSGYTAEQLAWASSFECEMCQADLDIEEEEIR